MTVRERILVAMSGGVDSSVAAARLHDAGFEVVGVTLHLWDYPDNPAPGLRPPERAALRGGHGRCCAPEDQYDARRVADAVGFAHFTFDRRALFTQTVVEPFVDAYLTGETPSPCSACNRGVKLSELFAIANRLGATRIATGHYARITRDPDGTPRLAMAADRTKDQSYFLYASPRSWLERLVFPLGESTKQSVRAEAAERRLPGADKGESQELCFVGGGQSVGDFVESRAADRIRPGLLVDRTGRAVAAHRGVHCFTVGQRRGLGVALGRRAFVTHVDAETAAVHLGDEADLMARSAELEDVVMAEGASLPMRARVRVRYRHDGDAALVVSRGKDQARVEFDAPVRAITRGQIAVLYEGDRVLGGGRISGSMR